MRNYLSLFLALICVIRLDAALPREVDFSANKNRYSPSDKAIFSADYEFQKTRDPITEQIPEAIHQKEMVFSSSIPSKPYQFGKQKTSNNLQDLETINWRSRGPVNVGGRFLSIVLDVDNEQHIIAGSASGGVWTSFNGGQSWTRTSSLSGEQSATCLVQDTRIGMHNVWYYGTGELHCTTDRRVGIIARTLGLGNGIFKSTDNGASWNQLSSSKVGQKAALTNVFQGVWNIITDKFSSYDVVYAACYGAIMRSSDGGKNWIKVLGDLQNKSFGSYIIQAANGVFYATLGSYSTDKSMPSDAGVWSSTDGLNWKDITPNTFGTKERTLKMASAPSDPTVIYLFTESPDNYSNDNLSFTASTHKFFVGTFDNSGSGTWKDNSSGLPGKGKGQLGNWGISTLGGYAMFVKVKPDNPKTVYLGSANLIYSTNAFTDSLKTVAVGGYPYNFVDNQLHPDQHDMLFLPSNINKIYLANDGGIQYKTGIDATQNWLSANNGLLASQYYWVEMNPNPAKSMLIGGLQDNGSFLTKTNDEKVPWEIQYGGDGMTCGFLNDDVIIVTVYNGATVLGSITDQNSGVYFGPNDPTEFSFYNNFTYDTLADCSIYSPSLNKIYRVFKIREALAANKSNIFQKEILSNLKIGTGEQISAITLQSRSGGRLFYGTNMGNLFRYDNPKDLTASGFSITGTDFPKNAFLSSIDVIANNPDSLLVTFSNYNVQSIFFSSNGGGSWIPVSGNLEEFPDGSGSGPSVRYIKSVRFAGNNHYLVATSTGLYSTNQLEGTNTKWIREAQNIIGDVIIDQISYREADGMIAVATQGSGVFVANLKKTISEVDESFSLDFLQLEQNSPNPVENTSNISFNLPSNLACSLIISDPLGKCVAKLFEGKIFDKGRNTIQFDRKGLSSGVYFYTLSANSNNITKKMIIK
ncbi:MAG: T9SS type A sorting domain-containing protein [Candidatus Kapabacteria bacterium]|nr:T9SS type A sorting domain-containing protein [Candidatus Kapabacteria bacterium]